MLSKIFPPESGPIIHSARQNIPLIGDSVQTEVVKSQRLSCACETYKNVENLCIGLDLVTLNVMCVCVCPHMNQSDEYSADFIIFAILHI